MDSRCNCEGRGFETSGNGKDQQYRFCPVCWERADEGRKGEIREALKQWKLEQGRLFAPSGRFA